MIYILDLGANDGCSIKKFKTYIKQPIFIYSFEPVPFFKRYLSKYDNNGVKVYYKAASNKNSFAKLYLSEGNDGSSLNGEKTSNGINKSKYITIETIDIAEFISNMKVEKDDEIWVKMDVEGEEYNIIPHLYDTKVLDKINRIFIEWHYGKLNNVSLDRHQRCVKMLENKNVSEWDALGFAERTSGIEYKKWKDEILNSII
jgi:FkbM family methyltransferase